MELWALSGLLFILKIYDVSQLGLVSRTSIGPLVADQRTFVYFSFIVLYICPLLFVSPLSLALSHSLVDSHITMDRTLTPSPALALVFRL